MASPRTAGRPGPVRAAAWAALACLYLVGCTPVEGTGDKGFVSADGYVEQLPAGERDDPVALAGSDLTGADLDLAAYRGKPTVVVVWGSWCAPCRAEAPAVVAAAEELAGTARFVGINLRDPSAAKAQAFVRTFDVPYPSFHSPGGEAMLAFSGTLTPSTIPAFVVLDAEGRVAGSIIGELPSTRTLVAVVEEVAAEGVAEPESPGSADG